MNSKLTGQGVKKPLTLLSIDMKTKVVQHDNYHDDYYDYHDNYHDDYHNENHDYRDDYHDA